jgi:membrane fusion protein, copper/silver efflux system
MSSRSWTAAMIGVALLAAALGYGLATRGRHGAGPNPAAPSTAPSAAVPAAGKRDILYWQDPMNPGVKFDHPGKSPFMDMPLVPVYADRGADAGGVVVGGGAQQSLGIRTGRVVRAVIAPHTIAVGSVRYDEHDIALVQPRVAGYVTRLRVRAELERVRRGQVLAEISAPAWTEAVGEYLALLRADSPAGASMREPARQRLLVIGVPEAAILELEKTRTAPATTTISAPIDGVVTELGLREGASFEAGAVLFRINGTATVWVDAQIPETQARAIVPGAPAEIRAVALPGVVLRGRVLSVLPQIDPATRTVGVRIAIDNSAGTLSPGMFVQASIAGAAGTPQLWVPSEAVIVTGERSVVIVERPDGSFGVAHVTLGMEVDGSTAILSGLEEGQTIVRSGQFLIDSEASLRSALGRIAGQPDQAAGSSR